MSAIFISHSSKDKVCAEQMVAWLREQGHQSLFLDFDPQNGIPGGRDWNKELHQQLRRCRAVIALLSEHFTASEWCKGEAWIASNLGKSIFPIRIGPCELPQMLRCFQAIDLTFDREDGFRRLARGLAEAGLDPKNIFQWDTTRKPFPGLNALEEADAPVFFGRDQEIQVGLDRLHNLRRFGGKGLLLVLGASGCGKSSLVRAGIVPRLRRDPENWLVLKPFRPRTDPFDRLKGVVCEAFQAAGGKLPAPPSTAQELKKQLEDLRRCGGHRDSSAVIVIDQFEELLTGGGSGSTSAASKSDEAVNSIPAERFLTFLREVIVEADGSLVVLATLRSDFLGTFQCHPSMVGVSFGDLKLGPMEPPGFARVIEGPAEVAGLHLGEGLVDQMVADTHTGDALPLLAFTLRDLWERYGKNRHLTLTEYKLHDGLEGSVQRAADEVLGARPLNEEETADLREAFLQLVWLTEEGQISRRQALWSEVPTASHSILERFVNARLLVSGKENYTQKRTLEVAHETLLRTWPTLREWLDQDRQKLEQQQRIRRRCEELNSGVQAVRLDALRSLESIARQVPQSLLQAEEGLVAVVADEQSPIDDLLRAEELLRAIRLLGKIGLESAEAHLRDLLERTRLLNEVNPYRSGSSLEVISASARVLQEGMQKKASKKETSELLIPTAMLRSQNYAVSTSLLRIKLGRTRRSEDPLMRVSAIGSEGDRGAWLEELAPDVSLTMLWIPPGCFWMGSPAVDTTGSWEDNPDFREQFDDFGQEEPRHLVRLKGFHISQTPITQAQWRAVAQWEPLEGENWRQQLNPSPSFFSGKDVRLLEQESNTDQRPVECIDRHDSIQFCHRLSQRFGCSYDLPSEAQWEYACRAGTSTQFHYGDAITTEVSNYAFEAKYNTRQKGLRDLLRMQTTPVGSFPANPWGLYDMHGNVWEWCLDDWHDSYEGAPTDGSAWLDPDPREEPDKVVRGGSWYFYPRHCRSASRAPSERVKGINYPRDFSGRLSYAFGNGIGFRVVCLP